MRVLVRGAGDLASGVALRLFHAGMEVYMTELPQPTAIRRTVCFSEAVRLGRCRVEELTGVLARTPEEAESAAARGEIPVLVDGEARCREALRPDVLVDGILAKRNLGTKKGDAPIVVALGPGFTAGRDCHAVVETMRGHDLGRVILSGSAQPNTAIPGLIGGFAGERVLRAPADGVFHRLREIGDRVEAGEAAGSVEGIPMLCQIGGVLRGILPDGTPVHGGMKAGDVDPRCARDYCFRVSDKALSVGGGVLEAVLRLSGALRPSGN